MSFKMFRYLERHYVGKYRVKARYDEYTGDFPRNENGGIDESFDEQYIPCKRGEIRHTYKNTRGKDILVWYCSGTGKGRNVYKEIKEAYPDIYLEVDEELDKHGLPDFVEDCMIYFDAKDIEKIATIVCPSTYGASIPDFVEDCMIYFDAKDIEKIATIVCPSTYGASIRPYSIRNLPKTPYTIPEENLQKYKDIVKKSNMETMEFAIAMRTINKEFSQAQDDKVTKKKKDYIHFSLAQKNSKLKYKEYVHSMGLWEEYLEFLSKKLEGK